MRKLEEQNQHKEELVWPLNTRWINLDLTEGEILVIHASMQATLSNLRKLSEQYHDISFGVEEAATLVRIIEYLGRLLSNNERAT